jgi:hypothetical protein
MTGLEVFDSSNTEFESCCEYACLYEYVGLSAQLHVLRGRIPRLRSVLEMYNSLNKAYPSTLVTKTYKSVSSKIKYKYNFNI